MKKIIVGNWKMNPEDSSRAKKLFTRIKRRAGTLRRARVVVCAPSLYIEALAKLASGNAQVGAQDGFYEKEGAFTGRVSLSMVRRTGASHVIIGHSEMRAAGDTNGIVSKKVRRALEERLFVILCVGEESRDGEGNYLSILSSQINESLQRVPKQYFKNIIVAYEPVWAIGAKAKSASTPSDFFEKSIFIRKTLSHIVGKDVAMKVPVLYGGSADERNAGGFLKEGKADGLLVGRASLDAESFIEILSLAEKV